MAKTDPISEILTRGVEEVIDRKHLEAALHGKKKMRIKLGIDPTAPKIHIGRAVVLWKLRALQELGHKIVIIIGDFTGLIGDTSDKDSERPMLSKKQVAANMKDYIAQIGKILDLKKTEFHFNSDWLKKLSFLEIAEQADLFSLHEFEARENIARRMKDQKRVSLRELLYPLMQGYDSVAIKANVEVGGNDQRFNLLAGRTMQKHYGQEPQDIMTFILLEGTDGRKMSSSWGNVINITDEPVEMYGKTMSILDSLIVKYFLLCTRLPQSRIEEIEAKMQSGELNPRDAKAMLAFELVRMYHGEKAAEAAEKHFDQVHRYHDVPEDIPVFKLEQFAKENNKILRVMIAMGAAKSMSEARRKADQGGVKVNGRKLDSYDYNFKSGDVIQVGPLKWAKIN